MNRYRNVRHDPSDKGVLMQLDTGADYHMHTVFSDGSASVTQMAAAAIEKGLHTIALTDHVPLPYPTRYAMDFDRITEFRQAVEKTGQQFEGRLEIKTGLEMEYIPRFREWFRSIADLGWGLTLASVHTLFVRDEVSLVNGNEAEFHRCLAMFKGDIKALVTAYYQTLQEAFATGWFDVAGHFDVVKKFNAGGRFFDEQSQWYQDLIFSTLRVLRDAGMKMEINTNGIIHPVAAAYPSSWIIEAASAMGIRIILGSDAHRASDVGRFFNCLPDPPETI
jgi:histidinol-phosphatase (PHP family)